VVIDLGNDGITLDNIYVFKLRPSATVACTFLTLFGIVAGFPQIQATRSYHCDVVTIHHYRVDESNHPGSATGVIFFTFTGLSCDTVD